MLLMEIEENLEKEEIYWVQRSRANWLKFGDRNTSFFHNFASARKKRNYIKRLLDDSGVWRENNEAMRSLITEYFQHLFSAEVNVPAMNVITKVKRRVMDYMNESLMAPYTEEEVRKALFSIGDLKAPGPDGLHAIFYKKFWHLLGGDLTKEVLAAVNTGTIPEGWNSNTIVLIPKVDNPEKITQFRPTSLCNVVYKEISKMLAARLKVFIPDLIIETQSAFVPGSIITDNVIVAYECLHTMKKRKKGKFGTCAIKSDMHKAYDRVEWVFLEAMLTKLGFHAQWIQMVMTCVRSVEYKVRFNSNETLPFSPTRGLRQGGSPLPISVSLMC